MADLGYEPSLELVERLKERARKEKITQASGMRALLMAEVEEIFRAPRRIAAINPPEVVLMIGVNGVGKTTTIAKLAHRARMQGKKVMIAAADTFRAAAIEQLQVWAGRVGALFHAKVPGSDPASVAYEAMDLSLIHIFHAQSATKHARLRPGPHCGPSWRFCAFFPPEMCIRDRGWRAVRP